MRRPESRDDLLTRICVGEKRAVYLVLVALWLAASAYFWQWWLRPEHIENVARYMLVTGMIGWLYVLQGYFLYFVSRASRSVARDPVPGQWRVAMITTKTPSEPFAVVKRTLEAMLGQDYPHDTWLADEDPSSETLDWCRQNGVKVSSRRGRPDYHRTKWPRRTRCKEGNLAFFYDNWGYAAYDVVSQLDADHVPQPGYLREMLRPFADPKVGYVSAPSVCSSNAADYWAPRTRLDTEAAFHGALQSGYSAGFAPMCIGSHYAVRTEALKAIGGLGPELAEDHSTTLMMNASGWRGVHAVDALAIGDGPTTVADLAVQEFQWSRSLVTIFLTVTPKLLRELPLRLRAQFLFCQLIYPALAVTMLAMYLLPIAAVLFDVRYAGVTYPGYIGHALPTVTVLTLIAYRLRHQGLLRPANAKILGWEKALFVLLQWPWVVWGCIAALRDRFSGRLVDFRITPKAAFDVGVLPRRLILVYSALALGAILPVLLCDELQNAHGFYLLTLLNAVFYTVVVGVIIFRHAIEFGGFAPRCDPKEAILQVASIAGLSFLVGTAVYLRAAESAHALAIGLEPLKLTRIEYSVSGAGGGQAGDVRYRFDIRWITSSTADKRG